MSEIAEDGTIRSSKLTFFDDYEKDTGPAKGTRRADRRKSGSLARKGSYAIEDKAAASNGRRSSGKSASPDRPSGAVQAKKPTKPKRLKNLPKRKR